MDYLSIYKNKNLFLILWIISIIFFGYINTFSNSNNIESKIDGVTNTEAHKVEMILKNDFKINQEASLALIVLSGSKKNIEELKIELLRLFSQFDSIKEITDSNNSKKHKYQLLYIKFKIEVKPRQSQLLVKNIRNSLRVLEKKLKLTTYLTGDSAFFYDTNTQGKSDSSKNEKIALMISFLILIFTVGSLLGAFLPIIIGLTTIIYLNGFISIFNLENNPISQILNSLIGLGLAIDYSLFIISRFKEEIKKNDLFIALKITLSSSGKTIFFSALIMILSISVLLIPDVTSSRTVVKSILSVIFISCFNSLIFLPCFLIITYKYLDNPIFLSKLIKRYNKDIFWKKFSTHITKYPKFYFVLSLSILIILAVPALNMKLYEPMQSMTPQTSESRIGYEMLKRDNWGGELIPVIIAFKTNKINENIFSSQSIKAIYDLTKVLEKIPEVKSVDSLTSWNKSFNVNDYTNFYNSVYPLLNFSSLGNNDLSKLVNSKTDTTLILVNPRDLMNIHKTTNIINFSKKYDLKNSDFSIYTGGVLARAKDFTTELYKNVYLMISLIFLGIFIILYFYMKTPVLPIKASIMNFLPILSSYGILTLVFQYGYFSDILDTPQNGGISTMVPIILFCIVFGLSMDYEVLILSRITENYDKGLSVRDSIIDGLSKSSSIISGAALILLGVFIPGIFSSSPPVKEICLGISAAILIDATLVRLILVPSFMMIMGKYNWFKISDLFQKNRNKF